MGGCPLSLEIIMLFPAPGKEGGTPLWKIYYDGSRHPTGVSTRFLPYAAGPVIILRKESALPLSFLRRAGCCKPQKHGIRNESRIPDPKLPRMDEAHHLQPPLGPQSTSTEATEKTVTHPSGAHSSRRRYSTCTVLASTSSKAQ